MLNKCFRVFLWQHDLGIEMLGQRHGWEFLGRQRLQGKARFAGLHRHPLVDQRQRDIAGIRQRAQNIQQFAGSNRSRSHFATAADLGMRRDLHFDIGCQERHAFAFLANEDIGQNRQRMPTLDNTAHDLQRAQQGVAVGFNQLHSHILVMVIGCCS